MPTGRQSTLGKFLNGGQPSAKSKPKQSTLAFNDKPDAKQSETGDKKTDTNGAATGTESTELVEEMNSDVEMTSSTPPKALKRASPDGEAAEEDSDEQPVVKKRRKGLDDEFKSHTASKSKAKDKTPVSATSDGKDAVSGDSPSEADKTTAIPDEKPAETIEKHKKIQATIKSSGKDPYPDWPAGDPVPYAALCTTFSLVEMTTKRLEISAHCSLFLQQVLRLTPNDLLPTVLLMINKVAADYAGIELGIGESLIIKAISESTGRTLGDTKSDHQKVGDLGLVAAKSRSNQRTMFKPKALTVKGVHEGLLVIAKLQGHGAQERKVNSIKKLLSAADAAAAAKGSKGIDITKDKGGASESKFLVRFLEGKLRLGLAERTVIVALSQAVVQHEAALEGKIASPEQMAAGEATLKTVYSELPSYEVIIPQILLHGLSELPSVCKLQPGVPLKPMLAKPTKSITEVLDRFEGKDFTCEYKYDGERAQIHYVAPDSVHQYPAAATTLSQTPGSSKGLASIFSRNSEDLSKKYPDILAKLSSWILPSTKSFVLDCETVAWDVSAKKVLPFQNLMTRKRKDVKAEDVKVRVCVFAFDMLFLNGQATVKLPLRERRQLLHTAFQPVEGEFTFAQYGDTADIEAIQTLLDDSVRASCEGLMVKMLDSADSFYEPSKRSRNWLKVKKDYLAGVGDSLDLVVLGGYHGRGKRTSVYGAFLLACYNPGAERFETVCNIGTGFSEALLEELHATLSQLVIDRPKPFYAHSTVTKDQPDVWFEPRLVWEVKTADLTMSPRYRAAADEMGGGKGISLRFPRYINSREDKKPEEATESAMIAEMYRRQESVGKEGKGGGVDEDFDY